MTPAEYIRDRSDLSAAEKGALSRRDDCERLRDDGRNVYLTLRGECPRKKGEIMVNRETVSLRLDDLPEHLLELIFLECCGRWKASNAALKDIDLTHFVE